MTSTTEPQENQPTEDQQSKQPTVEDASDPALASSAPEADAQHPLPDPAQPQPQAQHQPTSSTQQAPPLTEHCTSSAPLESYTPKGEISTLNTIPAYVSKPASYPSAPARLLLLLTNGAGHTSPNNQLQADLFAARGFVVVVPDQFAGDPAPNVTHADPEEHQTWIEKIKAGLGDVGKSFLIDMWLARHTEVNVLPRVQKALEGAREEFTDAVANGGGVYGVGYCFGAKYILQLLGAKSKGQSSEEGKAETAATPELKAGAIAHGTLVTADDIEGVKAPVAMACVERDNLFSDEIREQGKASLELNGVEHDVRVFRGVPHGFAVAGDYGDVSIKAKQEEAFEMMAGWLESH